ncbi:hypothetical protein BT63DRAFT_424458 [Microthyrium microscopicum]|uniref:Uncharacterized protein n=1 Tax=Microthyrium microscopicum TaxID=703497 RepID=A0A6A6UDW9_9PEZI|nr:hypothetical protein BT63DRAFT_424458 [Microthyrium microscopicum]
MFPSDICKTARMPRPKRPLADANTNSIPERSTGNKRTKASKNNTTATAASASSPRTITDEFITFARPIFDRRDEWRKDKDFDSDDEDATAPIEQQLKDDLEKYTGKPLRDFPGHKWTVSKKGKELAEKYALARMKSDQDMFDLHIFNDYVGYAEQEIIENMIVDFTTEFSKKSRSPLAIWSCMEAIALYMNVVEIRWWYMIDAGDQVQECATCLAYTFFAAIGVLKQENLLKPDSPIPNISLVVAMLLRWFSIGLPDHVEVSKKIPRTIVHLMKENNVPISGLHDMSFMVCFNGPLDGFLKKVVKNFHELDDLNDPFAYLTEHREYVANYGTPKIGGSRYDITRMTKKERKQHSFSTPPEDPMAKIPKGFFDTPPAII